VARKVAAELAARHLLAQDLLAQGTAPSHHLCVTDNDERFRRIAHELLPSLADSLSLELVEV
jgi:signal transduction histidine kinase